MYVSQKVLNNYFSSANVSNIQSPRCTITPIIIDTFWGDNLVSVIEGSPNSESYRLQLLFVIMARCQQGGSLLITK